MIRISENSIIMAAHTNSPWLKNIEDRKNIKIVQTEYMENAVGMNLMVEYIDSSKQGGNQ